MGLLVLLTGVVFTLFGVNLNLKAGMPPMDESTDTERDKNVPKMSLVTICMEKRARFHEIAP